MNAVGTFAAGLGCKCPRCGRGRLLKGFLEVRESCEVCDLDLSNHDTGDGHAVFVVFLVGAIATGLALGLESAFAPPVWMHLAVLIPVTVSLSVALLRPFKGVLVALHYRNVRE